MYRNFGLECGIDLFPAYNKLTKQKEQCYPDLVTISQTLATVNPKDAIIKTLERMNLVLNFVEIAQMRNEVSEIIFEMKVGFDGSTSNSMYNCPFKANESDQYIFS